MNIVSKSFAEYVATARLILALRVVRMKMPLPSVTTVLHSVFKELSVSAERVMNDAFGAVGLHPANPIKGL